MTLIKSVEDIVKETKNPLLGINENWERIELDEIAEILNGFAFKSKFFTKQSEGKPIIRIRDVGKTKTELENWHLKPLDDAYSQTQNTSS